MIVRTEMQFIIVPYSALPTALALYGEEMPDKHTSTSAMEIDQTRSAEHFLVPSNLNLTLIFSGQHIGERISKRGVPQKDNQEGAGPRPGARCM